jgi:hypothetical protein
MNSEIRIWPEADQVVQVVWTGRFKYRNREAVLSMTWAGFDEFDGAHKMVSAGRVCIEDLLAELEFTLKAQSMS